MLTINELVNESNEARAILLDFKERSRVHLCKPIYLNRLYTKLFQKGFILDRDKFEEVFTKLEVLGFGKAIRGKRKRILCFQPLESLRKIGSQGTKSETIPIEPKHTKVVVLFRMNGQKCKAEIPSEVVNKFEQLIGL